MSVPGVPGVHGHAWEEPGGVPALYSLLPGLDPPKSSLWVCRDCSSMCVTDPGVRPEDAKMIYPDNIPYCVLDREVAEVLDS